MTEDTMKTFEDGEDVYNLYGRAGRYVAPVAGGHVVQPIYDNEGDTFLGDVETWREIFKVPPVARLQDDIAALEESINAKRTELDSIREEIRAAQRERSELLKKFTANPDFTDLQLWMSGKVTHIVSMEYGSIKIGTLADILTRSDDREKTLRLLALHCDPRVSKYWIAYSGYSDGSGGMTRCRLATSIEQARELASAWIAEEVKGQPNLRTSLAIQAVRLDIPISDEMKALAVDAHYKVKQNALDEARKSFERARDKLAELEQSFP